MDLSSFEIVADGVDMPVRNPATGDPLKTDKGEPITIRVVGMDDDRFKAVEREVRNKVLRQGQKAKFSADDMDAQATRALIACTIGWQNIVLDGKALPHSNENARLLYSRLPWLRDQVNEFVAERANFLKTASAS